MTRRIALVLSIFLSLVALITLGGEGKSAQARESDLGSAEDDSLSLLCAEFMGDAALKKGTLHPADELWNGWTWQEQRNCLSWLSRQRQERFRRDAIVIEIHGERMAELEDGVTICYVPSGVYAPPPVVEAGSPEPASPDTNAVVVDTLPELNSIPAPEYPPEARNSGMTGLVTLTMLVGKTGRVRSILVVSGPSVFHRSAVHAAREARFVPAKYKGEPVPVWVSQPIRFSLATH